jgi:myo-inositol-1(or 4)-monophosphatase
MRHSSASLPRFLLRLATQAGELLLRRLPGRRTIRTKRNSSDVVTEMDLRSEKLILGAIRREFPGDEIVAEESGRAGRSRRRWFVDPLDGTVNYAHGLPIFCVSIGFELDGVMESGVVFAPALGELFTASRGRGAFRNGRPIRCSPQRDLRRSLLCTGFPYAFDGKKRNLSWWGAFLPRAQALRRLGSAALDLCFTACGVFDGFWEFRLGPWDIAAATLIAREAGAVVTDFRGGPVDLFEGEVLVANPALHAAMKRIIARF